MTAKTKQEAQCCQDLSVRCAKAEMERDATKASEKRPCDMDLEEFKTAAAEQVRLIVDAGKPPSKFPSTMDATVWGAALRRSMQDDGCSKVEGWFQAALSFAYVRGSEETLEKQKLAARPNSVSPLDSFDSRDWAKEFMSRFRGLTGSFIDEELMVGWFANALMRGYDEHRWKLERESPAGPPSDLERLETTMRLHHEWAAKNISNLRETLQIRTLGLDAPALKRRLDSAEKQVDWLTERLPELEHSIANPDLKLSRRIDELDERMKAAHDAHVDQTVKWADELDKRLSDLEARTWK